MARSEKTILELVILIVLFSYICSKSECAIHNIYSLPSHNALDTMLLSFKPKNGFHLNKVESANTKLNGANALIMNKEVYNLFTTHPNTQSRQRVSRDLRTLPISIATNRMNSGLAEKTFFEPYYSLRERQAAIDQASQYISSQSDGKREYPSGNIIQTFMKTNENPRIQAHNQMPQNLKKTNVISTPDFLQFITTSKYFLPKYYPNYKQMDIDHDRIHLQRQSHLYNQRLSTIYPNQHMKYQNMKSVPEKLNDSTILSASKQRITMKNPLNQKNPALISPSSYHTSPNLILVKSDGNNAIKHYISSNFSNLRPSGMPSRHYNEPESLKQEPLRFTFTEQDAIGIKSNMDSSKLVLQSKNTLSTTSPSIVEPNLPLNLETKESPDVYCERLCSHVYEINDEILCGSDGYMYIGESQLNCYSSCLKIDVTIQNKGSCS